MLKMLKNIGIMNILVKHTKEIIYLIYLQNNQQSQQQPRYQNVSLPEPVYDQVYAGRQPNPLSFRDIKGYVNRIKEQIEKFNEEYKV